MPATGTPPASRSAGPGDPRPLLRPAPEQRLG